MGCDGLPQQRHVHPHPIRRLFQCASQPGHALRSESRGSELAVDEEIPVISTRNRTRVCRITHKSIYRELGVPNIRHRRNAGLSVYLRRLLSLDYVIDHSELEWLPTEDEKVRFCTHYGVPHNRLPHRIYGGAAGCVARYFHLKLPFAGGPTCTFVYVDPGNDTATEMRYWGQTHEHLWARLRHRGITIHVAAIGVTPDADKRARAVLDGWARDRDGVRAGDYREAGLREELDALSRGIDTFDSQDLRALRGPAQHRAALARVEGHAGKTFALQHPD